MKFWVVTTVRDMSDPELGDICFLTDVREIMLFHDVGLQPREIVASFHEEQHQRARALAEQVLENHKKLITLYDETVSTLAYKFRR